MCFRRSCHPHQFNMERDTLRAREVVELKLSLLTESYWGRYLHRNMDILDKKRYISAFQDTRLCVLYSQVQAFQLRRSQYWHRGTVRMHVSHGYLYDNASLQGLRMRGVLGPWTSRALYHFRYYYLTSIPPSSRCRLSPLVLPFQVWRLAPS